MNKAVTFFLVGLILGLLSISQSQAAVWVKLQESNSAKLMLDKQSMLETDKMKRAWVKILYKTPQTNPEVAEKTYNLSKNLWFFDCATQKAATAQVFQFSNDDIIYSAAVESKSAKFIEPVPETDIDVAMRYVCGISVPADLAKEKPEVQKAALKPEDKGTSKSEPDAAPKDAEKKDDASNLKSEKSATSKPSSKPDEKAAKKPELSQTKVTEALVAAGEKSNKLAIKPIQSLKPDQKVDWSYEGDKGPENWAKLSPEYAICGSGHNQSPINIDQAITAELKPLKVFQRFPATDIVNDGHILRVNFKQGNMLVLDSVLYHLQQLSFHAPSENTIKGKSYPIEAHFVHMDPGGNIAVLAVMFEEGAPNIALEQLHKQMPRGLNTPSDIKSRVVPSDLMPRNMTYYRFGGSLTVPPCTEGVHWIVMKTPVTASAGQIEWLKAAVKHTNNRPVQPANGRLVVN